MDVGKKRALAAVLGALLLAPTKALAITKIINFGAEVEVIATTESTTVIVGQTSGANTQPAKTTAEPQEIVSQISEPEKPKKKVQSDSSASAKTVGHLQSDSSSGKTVKSDSSGDPEAANVQPPKKKVQGLSLPPIPKNYENTYVKPYNKPAAVGGTDVRESTAQTEDRLQMPEPEIKPQNYNFSTPSAESIAKTKEMLLNKKRDEEIKPQNYYFAAPPPASNEPFKEKIVTEENPPKYLRINVDHYNVRRTADFNTSDYSNVAFAATKGQIFKVDGAPIAMQYGKAVPVLVNGERRWVYYDNNHKDVFDLCDTDVCLGPAVKNSLEFFLAGSKISSAEAKACGVTAGPEGLILPQPVPQPRIEPDPPAEPAPKPRPSTNKLTARPLWESKVTAGKAWTAMMMEALEKHGQKLLNKTYLQDSEIFCPNYSMNAPPSKRLTREERKEFWLHLFNGIALNESGFKLGKPAFNEAGHHQVWNGPINPETYSMGLFQISYNSSRQKRYQPGCAGVNWKADRGKSVQDPSLTIYDPEVQINCAVSIMSALMKPGGGVGWEKTDGGARFWSTLRSTNGATRNVIESLKQFDRCFE